MTVAVAGVVAGAGGIAGAVAGAGAVALAVGGAGADAVAVAVAVAFAFPVLVAGERSREQGRLATFELLFTMLCFAVCLALALGLGASPDWRFAGPLLLFFGLLTLVNAPFDWLSLGLTRGLLRRGLELGGAWPWVLALVDGLLATVLVVLLSAAMVLAVQLFDALAVHRGGKAVLPLEPLFVALAADPAAPEHWWIYALLATTLLPSLVNAVVGCASWLRSLPWLNLWLQRQMPARQGSAAEALVYHRVTVAAVLTSQWALGAVIGAVALPLWVWVWLVWLMPFAGPNLMELMRALAEQHWPQRLIAAWL